MKTGGGRLSAIPLVLALLAAVAGLTACRSLGVPAFATSAVAAQELGSGHWISGTASSDHYWVFGSNLSWDEAESALIEEYQTRSWVVTTNDDPSRLFQFAVESHDSSRCLEYSNLISRESDDPFVRQIIPQSELKRAQSFKSSILVIETNCD
jgi:hypothetical protein